MHFKREYQALPLLWLDMAGKHSAMTRGIADVHRQPVPSQESSSLRPRSVQIPRVWVLLPASLLASNLPKEVDFAVNVKPAKRVRESPLHWEIGNCSPRFRGIKTRPGGNSP